MVEWPVLLFEAALLSLIWWWRTWVVWTKATYDALLAPTAALIRLRGVNDDAAKIVEADMVARGQSVPPREEKKKA